MDLQINGRSASQLPKLLDAAEMLGFAGVNITHPCKQAVVPLLNTLSPEAEAIGAVNAVTFRAGKRTGHNTDWLGFSENFHRELPGVCADNVLLLGAGGGGSAVCYAALRMGAQCISIFDQDYGRAERLSRQYTAQFGGASISAVADPASVLHEVNGVIHATPVGMIGHPGMALAPELLRSELWVAELVYFPLETELLLAARQRGCLTLDGGGMAVFQAAEAFRLFTGVEPDRERMLAQFRAALHP